MKIWTDGCDTFKDKDEAYDSVYTSMSWEDYEEYFKNNVNFHDFFERVRKITDPDKFFMEFENEFCDAANKYFEENYWEEDEEEE